MLELVVARTLLVLPKNLRRVQYDWPGWYDFAFIVGVFAVALFLTWWVTKNDKLE